MHPEEARGQHIRQGGDYRGLTAEGNEVVGRHHGIELLRAPGATVASLTFEGTDGNDQVRLGRLTGALPNPIPLIFHGGTGRDRLTFTDSDQWLEEYLARLHQNICTRGVIMESVQPVLHSFDGGDFSSAI